MNDRPFYAGEIVKYKLCNLPDETGVAELLRNTITPLFIFGRTGTGSQWPAYPYELERFYDED